MSKPNLIISASSLDSFGTCERMFNFGTVMNLKHKSDSSDKQKMHMGSLMHKILELHYTLKSMKKPYGDLTINCVDFGRFYAQKTFSETLDQETVETVVRTYKQYAMHYKDENYVVDRYENHAAVEVPFAKILFEDDEIRIIVEGIIDWLGINNQYSIVMDHKTGAQEPHALENQFQLYAFVSKKDYVIVNRISFTDKKNPFQRVPYKYTAEMKQAWAQSIVHKVKRINRAVREGYFEPNFKMCRNYNSPCQFFDICTQEEKYWPAVISTNYVEKEPFNPMKDKESIEEVLRDIK